MLKEMIEEQQLRLVLEILILVVNTEIIIISESNPIWRIAVKARVNLTLVMNAVLVFVKLILLPRAAVEETTVYYSKMILLHQMPVLVAMMMNSIDSIV